MATATATKMVSYGFAKAIATAIKTHEFVGYPTELGTYTAEQLLAGEMVTAKNGSYQYCNYSFLQSTPWEFGQGLIDFVNSLPKKVNSAVPVPAVPVPAVPVSAVPSNAGLNNGESELAILVRREIAAAIAEAGIAERSIVPVPATDHIKVVESPNVDQVVMTLRPGNPVELLNENGTGTGVWAAFKGTFTDGGKPQWEYFTTNPAK